MDVQLPALISILSAKPMVVPMTIFDMSETWAIFKRIPKEEHNLQCRILSSLLTDLRVLLGEEPSAFAWSHVLLTIRSSRAIVVHGVNL